MDFTISAERPALLVSAAAAPSGSTITLVTIRVTKKDGKPGPHNMGLWLSDASTGAGDTAVTASGAVAAGASGVIVFSYTAKKHFLVQTTAAGVFILSITDSAKTPFYVCVEIEGRTYVVLQLATASYGP